MIFILCSTVFEVQRLSGIVTVRCYPLNLYGIHTAAGFYKIFPVFKGFGADDEIYDLLYIGFQIGEDSSELLRFLRDVRDSWKGTVFIILIPLPAAVEAYL